MTHEITSEYATHIYDGRWKPGPQLQILLDDGWEPFHVSDVDSTTVRSAHGPSCPLVWLKRDKP